MENKREINNNDQHNQKNENGQEINDEEIKDQEMIEQQENDLLNDSQEDICEQLRDISVNTPTKKDPTPGTKVSKNILQLANNCTIKDEPKRTENNQTNMETGT